MMQLVGVCLVAFLPYTVLACLVSHTLMVPSVLVSNTLMVPSVLLLVARRCGTELPSEEVMHLAYSGWKVWTRAQIEPQGTVWDLPILGPQKPLLTGMMESLAMMMAPRMVVATSLEHFTPRPTWPSLSPIAAK